MSKSRPCVNLVVCFEFSQSSECLKALHDGKSSSTFQIVLHDLYTALQKGIALGKKSGGG
jgi:hypothetical protein